MVYRHSHFGVYALIREGAKVLVIRKARGPYTGLYDLPGGSPEPDESPQQTLSREVLEETGCVVTGYTSLGPVEAQYNYQSDGRHGILHHTGLLFEAVVEGVPRVEGDGHDSHGCVWMLPDALTNANATPFVQIAMAKAHA